MRKLHQFSHAGFTIVELIIVIIVIAIIATITLVGYSGVQKTAYNTQIVAGVVQYRDTVEAYKAFFKKYPQTIREIANEHIAMVCLGSGYPDTYCGIITGVPTYEDPAFNEELRKIGEGGSVSSLKLNINGETFVGAAYGIDTVPNEISPTGWARTIQYALKGKDTDCGIEGAWAYALQDNPPITACEIELESVPAP